MPTFTDYLKELFNSTLNIILLIVDLAGIFTLFVLVVDDQVEFWIVLVFIIIVHLGNFLIYRKQAVKISQLETIDENESEAIRTMLRIEIQQNIENLSLLWDQVERSRQAHIQAGHEGDTYYKGLAIDFIQLPFTKFHFKTWLDISSIQLGVALNEIEIERIEQLRTQLERITHIRKKLIEYDHDAPEYSLFGNHSHLIPDLWLELEHNSQEILATGNPL